MASLSSLLIYLGVNKKLDFGDYLKPDPNSNCVTVFIAKKKLKNGLILRVNRLLELICYQTKSYI